MYLDRIWEVLKGTSLWVPNITEPWVVQKGLCGYSTKTVTNIGGTKGVWQKGGMVVFFGCTNKWFSETNTRSVLKTRLLGELKY